MNVNCTCASLPGRAGRWSLGLLAVLAVLAVSACGDLPLSRDSGAFSLEVERAQRLAVEGRHAAAAREFERLADAGPVAEQLRMGSLAAREYLAANRLADARRVLPAPARVETREQRLVWAPVAASLALAEDRPEEAQAALARLPEQLPDGLQATVLALRGQIWFMLGDPVAGVRALLARQAWLAPGEAALLDNQRLIWRGLQGAGNAVLAAAREQHDDRELAGWLALGVIAVNAARNPFGVGEAIAHWRQSFDAHPANAMLVDEVLATYRSLMDYPQRIALILPLSGRQQGVGLAVRDGFMAAHFEHRRGAGERSVIEVYDSGERAIAEVYREAMADGADFIVGPLLREEVLAIESLAGPVATLALNQLADDALPPPNFFQFALAPEDEAEQVARLASLRHGGRAVALVPNDDWGRRLLASFSTALSAQGGRLIEYASYDTWEQDFSQPITRMLQLDESEERRRRLAAVAGTQLEFQPRRRQDADFLFLAARTPHARLIRPQLRYFFAGNLPTYAPSAVFQPGGGADGDLNGIIFPDAPWLLDPDESMQHLKSQIETAWPGRGDRLGRLYAMGFDAYRLVPLLFSTTSEAGMPAIDAMSGRLTLSRDGRIQRTLAWAQFRGGRPVALSVPELETLEAPATELEEVELAGGILR